MTNKDNEFESFMHNDFEDFYNDLSKNIWKDIHNLTTLNNSIDLDYIDTKSTNKYTHINTLISNLIMNNVTLFPNQNSNEKHELTFEFRKLLGMSITKEEQFKLGIHPEEIKFIRYYLQEKITPSTPFQYWECSYQFKQNLYYALVNVWKLIINAITPFQIKNIELSNSISLDNIVTRVDFREIIKKRPTLYFYIDKALKISKKNKTKLFPNCKLTYPIQDNEFYEISPEDLLASNDYEINYTEQSIQINSVFLNHIALTDISNRQIIVPTYENMEYLQENLKDIQSYLTLLTGNFNISLQLNQVYIQNENLIELGINQPTIITKTEQRNTLLTQLIKDNSNLVHIDGITCTITKSELWEICAGIDRRLFASGKDDFFNKSKNPKISEIIKFDSGAPKKIK